MSKRLTYTSGTADETLNREFERRLVGMRETVPQPFTHVVAGREIAEGDLLEHHDPCGLSSQPSRAHCADVSTVAAAVAAARQAAPRWRRTPYSERCRLLRAVADRLSAVHIELAAAISLETGKVRSESIAEVQEALDLIETYCGASERAEGFTSPMASLDASECNFETLRPYGAFGVIVPFNFPVALAVNMFAAALIAGNTVVVKPSQATPRTSALLGAAVGAAGLPIGAFNLVHGGPDTGRALVEQDVDGVAFTGSVEVGQGIAARLSRGPWPRPVLAEMGGKNAAIVTARADLQKAAEGIARAAFGLSGQKCSSCSRAIVVDDVYDEFVRILLDFARTLPVGDPVDRSSALGPVIDARAVRRFEQSVALAREGGRVLLGGERMQRDGCYVEPTIVDGLAAEHPLMLCELFLPFLALARVGDLTEAIAQANAVDYGLSAGIFSEDEQEVQEFLDRIEAGVLYVNRRAGATTGAWPGSQSFCGWKASGLTGKGGLGPYYLPQFMREQSRTIVR